MRFREFKDNWSLICLNQILNISIKKNGFKYTKKNVYSVSKEYGIINQIELLGRSFAGKNLSKYNIIQNNDIVYTKSPLATCPFGIIKVNRKDEGIVSTLYGVFKAKLNFYPIFLEYLFSLDSRLNNYLKPLVHIGAKHTMNISNFNFLKGSINTPNSLLEQIKIANFLSLIDKQIELQNKIIKEYKLLKKK
ncbi:restriction endonuclease subunit S [Metamycoplasma buccale]|uniref:restriction endonuclease subunit S n=1 Tax=Metamycoplasma buccale TaxID=55602 RepID=UPI00398F3C32